MNFNKSQHYRIYNITAAYRFISINVAKEISRMWDVKWKKGYAFFIFLFLFFFNFQNDSLTHEHIPSRGSRSKSKEGKGKKKKKHQDASFHVWQLKPAEYYVFIVAPENHVLDLLFFLSFSFCFRFTLCNLRILSQIWTQWWESSKIFFIIFFYT